MKIPAKFDESVVKTIDFDQTVVTKALVAAAASVQELQESLPETVADVESSGARFYIPLAVPEGVASGDERIFDPESITVRDLPLPLRWQIISDEGHKGSVVVGRIDSIDRIEGGLGNARGVFDIGAYGREAERLVRGGFLRGVSVDVDKFEASSAKEEGEEEFADKDAIKNQKIRIKSARLMGITIVPMPAFQEATIMIEEEPIIDAMDEEIPDGVYEQEIEDEEGELASLAASAAPVIPPRQWFSTPELRELTPITVEDDGRVYGHIASWNTTHIGRFGVKPPRSASKYAYFRTGVLRTDDGTDVAVGQLTLAGGHAGESFNAQDAVKHYDDTASAVADVTAGEDKFGIWVSGALRPEATAAQVRALRASAPSGDWRPIGNRLELVAVCQVNVPGFPVPRAIVASAGGEVTALIAAGAAEIAEKREDIRFREMEQRLARMEFAVNQKAMQESMARFADLEDAEKRMMQERAEAAFARLDPDYTAHNAELTAKIEALAARFND